MEERSGQQLRDSVSESEELTAIWREGVKADSVKMKIPVDTLLKLPEGAVYTARSGRATIRTSVKRKKDGRSPVIVVEAGCDSLERELRMLKSRRGAALSRTERQESTKEPNERGSKPIRMALLFIAGIATGVVITIKTKKIWQKVY